MKQNIHPNWFENAKVTCNCGNTFTTGSTEEVIRLDICSKCHPFYTGTQKFVDTLGQVDRFQKKVTESAGKAQVKQAVLAHRASKAQKQKEDKPSLKDLLMQARKNLHS